MEQPATAILLVDWHGRDPEKIPVQYNPTELSFDKSAQIAEIAIPGLDSPLQQFVRGQAEKLSIELFFDTTDKGMGRGATSVTTLTDRIYQLVKIEPKRHAPPICTFIWGDKPPGSTIGGVAGEVAAMVGGGPVGALLGALAETAESAVEAIKGALGGNQNRNGFRCIVESVKQKFTLFSPEGLPLRATLSVTLREYKTLEEQLAHLNLTSPDRTHAHVTQRGQTLSGIAGQYYRRPGEWRHIADENDIEDPRRLAAGVFLTIPPMS
jgi:Contractile injection system tube protein